MENITKATTKTWYVCGKCQEKMETISIKSNDSDLFGLSLGGGKAFYCDNKDCDKFGYLTVAGIKKEE